MSRSFFFHVRTRLGRAEIYEQFCQSSDKTAPRGSSPLPPSPGVAHTAAARARPRPSAGARRMATGDPARAPGSAARGGARDRDPK